jgi:hypothetical protein
MLMGEVTTQNSSAVLSSYVQFNETQILVRTNVEEIADYVIQSHKAMIVPAGERVVGRIDVLRSERGYLYQGTERLDFAGEPHLLFPLITREILRQFMRAHSDLLWVHAAVVALRGRAVLIVGPPTHGKSTLATRLVALGWEYLSDETAPVRLTTDEVLPYSRTPARRMNPGREVADHESTELDREVFELGAHQIHRSPATIGLIVYPRFVYGFSAKLALVKPGEACVELLRNLMNLPKNRSKVVAKAASLCGSIDAYSLIHGDGEEAAGLLHRLALKLV